MKKRAFTGKVTYNILFCKFFDHFFCMKKKKIIHLRLTSKRNAHEKAINYMRAGSTYGLGKPAGGARGGRTCKRCGVRKADGMVRGSQTGNFHPLGYLCCKWRVRELVFL